MPKSRKRSQPITEPRLSRPSSTASSHQTRTTIRNFHQLLKRQSQLQKLGTRSRTDEAELLNISKQMDALGGLNGYQSMSVTGQASARGGGSEKVLISWLKELGLHETSSTLLEVGALKADNYRHCPWLNVTPMDLNSRHPNILEQDFLTLDANEHHSRWNIISLSLVVNFVPIAEDRGRMLELAHTMLAQNGLIFIVLPLPCIFNSRYTTPEHFDSLLECIGFDKVRSHWKTGGKMAYWLFRKSTPPVTCSRTTFQKKTVLRTGNRNNFLIKLP
ncbi:putative methyltransferase-domain-containing protein [Flagelloscypha sp. PMI_526]|nr:putative methyltransferase-domain-containing protein [Flagelloscypha sp. PMI_526]